MCWANDSLVLARLWLRAVRHFATMIGRLSSWQGDVLAGGAARTVERQSRRDHMMGSGSERADELKSCVKDREL